MIKMKKHKPYNIEDCFVDLIDRGMLTEVVAKEHRQFIVIKVYYNWEYGGKDLDALIRKVIMNSGINIIANKHRKHFKSFTLIVSKTKSQQLYKNSKFITNKLIRGRKRIFKSLDCEC